MININNLSFKYEDKYIFNDLNLKINKNKITFIIGKNGSGKSTLSKLISGLIYPNKGSIKIDNLEINKKVDPKILRKKVGYVFQNPDNQLLFSKVYDDMKFTLDNLGIIDNDEIIKNSLIKTNMLDYINSNPYKLSGGEKQRINISNQISFNPDYLIMDEVTSNLDIESKYKIYNLIKVLKKNMGIIYITNDLSELIYADEILIIDNNNIYNYHINDLLKNNNIFIEHDLKIPFIFKLCNKLNINNKSKLNEKNILDRINYDK